MKWKRDMIALTQAIKVFKEEYPIDSLSSINDPYHECMKIHLCQLENLIWEQIFNMVDDNITNRNLTKLRTLE